MYLQYFYILWVFRSKWAAVSIMILGFFTICLTKAFQFDAFRRNIQTLCELMWWLEFNLLLWQHQHSSLIYTRTQCRQEDQMLQSRCFILFYFILLHDFNFNLIILAWLASRGLFMLVHLTLASSEIDFLRPGCSFGSLKSDELLYVATLSIRSSSCSHLIPPSLPTTFPLHWSFFPCKDTYLEKLLMLSNLFEPPPPFLFIQSSHGDAVMTRLPFCKCPFSSEHQ